MKVECSEVEIGLSSAINTNWRALICAIFGYRIDEARPTLDADDPLIVGEMDKQIATLTKREALILKCRFSHEKLTLEKIASLIGVSRGRVRQIESKALRRLRHPSRIVSIASAIGEINQG